MKKVLAVFLISFMLFCYVSCNDVPKVSEDDTPVSIESNNESQGQVELCERIAKSLSVNEIDKASNLSSQLVKPLTSEEKEIVMNALVERINNRMGTFSKSFGSKQSLISDEILVEIEKYQTIVDNVGITDSNNTNVTDYLSQVSALSVYSKYNDYWAYYYAIKDDLNSANEYWKLAFSSTFDYLINQYLTKALSHFKTCLSRTYNYNAGSFGIKEARDFFQLYVDKINYYFDTGENLSLNEAKISAYERAANELVAKGTELIDKLESLPTSVYYD